MLQKSGKGVWKVRKKVLKSPQKPAENAAAGMPTVSNMIHVARRTRYGIQLSDQIANRGQNAEMC
jgi:hypothetical protein